MSPLLATSQEQVIIDWITGLGWDTREEAGYPLVIGPYIPRSPDKMVIITGGDGPGFILDGAADASNFQVRLRGPQNDQFTASSQAALLDAMIFSALFPAMIDGVSIVHIHRVGSGPSPLGGGPDDAYRYEYTCNYLMITGVGI